MSIQSDKWIKKMAKEYGMISPFEEEQQQKENLRYTLAPMLMPTHLKFVQVKLKIHLV